MQHLVHIFIGDELVSFGDQFASMFHKLNPEIESQFFTALSLIKGDNDTIEIKPVSSGDTVDSISISKTELNTEFHNFIEDIFIRKVTVAHPGNKSLVVMLWGNLFLTDYTFLFPELVEILDRCPSKIITSISGFTNDAVSCFIKDKKNRLDPTIYYNNFLKNISVLRELRLKVSAVNLISNRNLNGLALNFNEETLAMVCAEYAGILCLHYTDINQSIKDIKTYPFESFGISSIKFDTDYFFEYLKNRSIIEKLSQHGVTERKYSINALARLTNPIIKATQKQIGDFYDKQVTHSNARLSLTSENNDSNIVADIDNDIDEIILNFRSDIENRFESEDISIFKYEALLALILGDDCEMFESSAVDAEELIADDIIEKSMIFFISLDPQKKLLHKVSLDKIKGIRSEMRNIAVANRHRQERINILERNNKEAEKIQNHLNGNQYHFHDTDYKLDLQIDIEPLETTYSAHEITFDSIDLRQMFCPIRNQGSQGSCSTFAISSVIEFMRQEKLYYSPAFLYWNARAMSQKESEDCGTSLYQVMKSAVEKGDCKEEFMPYDQDVYDESPSEMALENALDCKILEAKNVEINLQSLKSALCDGYPVIIASKIFNSFAETLGGFVPHPSDSELDSKETDSGHGCHAMVLCGFSDKDKVFVVRNSWGTDFGDKGYCYIPYSYAIKYFYQACIITEITHPREYNGITLIRQTLEFNIHDSNIETAILKNLIGEDNYELSLLKKESNLLKTAWTQNIGLLGNVNNQKRLLEEAQNEISDKIASQREKIEKLQNSFTFKLDEFKKASVIRLVAFGLISLIAWLVVWIIPSVYTFAFAGIFTLLTISFSGKQWWDYRNYRNELIEDIQRESDVIDNLKAKLESLRIQAHIHGKIIMEIGNLKTHLQNRFQIIKMFNSELVALYNRLQNRLSYMSPEMPYPFMNILSNPSLDNHYNFYKDKVLSQLDIISIFKRFNIDSNIEKIISYDTAFANSIMSGLKGFCLRDHIIGQKSNKWLFLPPVSELINLIQNMDQRAVPFCSPNTYDLSEYEKFIFISTIESTDNQIINQHFQQAPLLVNSVNPYSVTILSNILYDIPQN